MGAEPWVFSTPYQKNFEQALQELRQQVFTKGNYYKSDTDANPSSIEDLFMHYVDEEGTHSILDIFKTSKKMGMGLTYPLTEDDLMGIFGTNKPTKEMLNNEQEIYNFIDRGESVYVISYNNDLPDKIFFFGYSFD
ncbi:MAG: hypothetical protein ACKE51_06955 [Methylococcaceae bacterium]